MKLSDEELVDSLINSYKHESSPYFSNDCKERSDLLALLKRGREAMEEVKNLNISLELQADRVDEFIKKNIDLEELVENLKCCGNCKSTIITCPSHRLNHFSYCPNWQSDKLTRKDRE